MKKIEIFRFFSVNSKKMAKILEKISKLWKQQNWRGGGKKTTESNSQTHKKQILGDFSIFVWTGTVIDLGTHEYCV